jgi:tryptophanyl-tRNA synthetase
VNEICPVGKEIGKLMNDEAYLIKVLQEGTEKAGIIAEENLNNIRDKIGLI